ncbi:MAG: SCO family protein, partial [Candidatus Dormibacteraeota bacterium]|nr:SCO family protein [Candidatus Dormibacteraeota bacterium]
PILLAVEGGHVRAGGVYAGAENVNLGLGELGGKLVPLAGFELIDQAGLQFTRQSLLGHDTLIAAFHTTCHETCPLYTGLLLQLRSSSPATHLVEVTTDPATDTPAALAAYAHGIGADWTFATGSLDAIAEFWAPFGVQPSAGDTHTSALVLVDSHGYIRTAFTGVPDVGGRLPGALAQQLDPAGRALLAGHGEGWGAPEVIDALRTVAGSAGTAPTGGVAPAFRLRSPAGATVALQDLRGRPVILNFWWTGCPPCRVEMPALQAFADSHPGATLLLIDNRDSAAAAAAYARSLDLRATVLLDSDGAVAAAYRVAGFPTTVLVGPDGLIRYQQPGPVDESALGLALANLTGA